MQEGILYLLLVIAAMSGFMLGLKETTRRGLSVPVAVITNYILAIGIALFDSDVSQAERAFDSSWIWWAIGGGVFLVGSMETMAISTRKSGLAITTIASKVAVTLPILYACLVLGEGIGWLQIVAIVLILLAMVFIFSDKKIGKVNILLPILVFVTMGGVKVSIKAAQHIIRLSGDFSVDFPLFNLFNFGAALVIAVVYYLITNPKGLTRWDWKSVVAGLVLGGCNYAVIMGLLNGLRAMKTSVFYPSYDVAVVIIVTIVGAIAYKEKQTPRKLIGIAIAIGALVMISL